MGRVRFAEKNILFGYIGQAATMLMSFVLRTIFIQNLSEQLLGINFWKEEPCTCAGVSASTQASVLIDESESQPEEAEVATPRIAVADPTKQDRTIELCVCGKTYTADTKGLEGRSVLLG